MEKEQLIAAGEAAFGKRWQTELSEALGVSVRTVRYWVVGKNKIPAKLSADIVLILKRRQKEIAEAITMATEKFLMNPETGSVDTEENWLGFRVTRAFRGKPRPFRSGRQSEAPASASVCLL